MFLTKERDRAQTIVNNLRDPNCQGFWMENLGDEIDVSKNDDGAINVIYKSYKGDVRIVDNETEEELLQSVERMLFDYLDCVCILHMKPTKWSDYEIEKFVQQLALDMCKPEFNGFDLQADGVDGVHVRRNRGGFSTWRVNDRGCEAYDVINYIKVKLEEDVYWNYVPVNS